MHNWQEQVEEWLKHPVTRAFMVEVTEDIGMLTEQLIYPSKDAEETYLEIRGMIKALRGVLGMGVTDPILNPETKGASNE